MDELLKDFSNSFEAWLLWAYAWWGVGVVSGVFICSLAWNRYLPKRGQSDGNHKDSTALPRK